MTAREATADQPLGEESRTWGWLALALVALLTLVRLFYLGLERYDIAGDEAQYWTWSQAPAWGYYSKPPIVAWVIWLTTHLFGESSFSIRMGSPIAHAGTGLLLYLAGARLFSRRLGFVAAVAYATLPAVFLSSILISTDPFLLFFWALALYAFVRAVDSPGVTWWAVLGLAIGLGTLSKFAMAMFPLSIALYFATTPRVRQVTGYGRPLVALGLALIVYSPNLWWNLENGLSSYGHTVDNADVHGFAIHPSALAEFVLSQFGVFGPILFASLIALFLRPRRLMSEPSSRLLVWLILPMAAMMLTVSVLSRANANWAAVVYVPATLLVASWLDGRGLSGLLRAGIVVNLALGGVILEFHDLARLAGIELTARQFRLVGSMQLPDPFRRVMGWQTIGDEVSVALAHYPAAVILADDRMLLATLMYAVHPHPLDAVKFNPSRRIRDHYDLTTDIERVRNRPFLFVSRDPDPQSVLTRFTTVEPLGEISSDVYNDLPRRYWLFLLDGFKGYAG